MNLQLLKLLQQIELRNIMKLKPLAKYRRILTGSPITNSPLDLFSQAAFLDNYLLGFDSFWAYRAHYCIMKLQ